MIALFGRDVALRSIIPEQAESFEAAYVGQGLAGATTHRRLKFAEMLFAHAVKKKPIPDDPFADVTVPNVLPADRRQDVTAEDVEELTAVSDPTWRVVFALCRYAGLRCPSEVASLKWADIDFVVGRTTATKTERTADRATRPCPIFAHLHPDPEKAREIKSVGEVGCGSGFWRAGGVSPLLWSKSPGNRG